jgi:phospholipid/cholesterol/gamma-HCH transport system ATP-binding protein
MNSVMEIGEYIMFLHQGEKKWEGSNDDLFDVDVPELNEFLFSNKLMRKFKH